MFRFTQFILFVPLATAALLTTGVVPTEERVFESAERSKREYTMIDYICHKQPFLSICRPRASSTTSKPTSYNAGRQVAYDPMPTPGPLMDEKIDKKPAPYDVAVRREEPKDESNWADRDEPKIIAVRTTTRRPNLDDQLLKSIEEFDESTERPPSRQRFRTRTIDEDSTTTSASTTTEAIEWTTTPEPEESTTPEFFVTSTTTATPEAFQVMSPQQRYQQEIRQYMKRYRSYFQQYPQAAAYYPSPDHYAQQLSQYYEQTQQVQQQPQFDRSAYGPQLDRPQGYGPQRQFYYPQHGYQQQSVQYSPAAAAYYPQQQQQQQSWNTPQSNYYQPGGFNFGIGSQLQIPYAGPLGISSGFGFSGKK